MDFLGFEILELEAVAAVEVIIFELLEAKGGKLLVHVVLALFCVSGFDFRIDFCVLETDFNLSVELKIDLPIFTTGRFSILREV